MGEIVKFFFAARRRAAQRAKHARNHVLANVAGYSCQNYNVFMIYHHQSLHRVLQHLLFSDAESTVFLNQYQHPFPLG